jgi:hypothetical protein
VRRRRRSPERRGTGRDRRYGHVRTRNTGWGGRTASRRSSPETAAAELIGIDNSGDNPMSSCYRRAQEVATVSVVAVVGAEVD